MSGTLIYKKQIISGAPEVHDEIKAADMKPVTSNAVASKLNDYPTQSELNDRLNNELMNKSFYIGNNCQQLPDYADLNDYAEGTYLCLNQAKSQTYKNCPYTEGNFKLICNMNIGTSADRYWGSQLLVAGSKNNILYYRGLYYSDNSKVKVYGEWEKILKESDLAPVTKSLVFESIATTTEQGNCSYTVVGKMCIVNLAGVTLSQSGVMAKNLPKAKTRANVQWPYVSGKTPVIFIEPTETSLRCAGSTDFLLYCQLIYAIAD